jgi:aromatase
MTVDQEGQRLVRAADIAAILVRNCGLDPDTAAANPAACLEELGMDSLAVLELQAVVTDLYRVEIPEGSGKSTITEIADLVGRQRPEV